MEQYGTKKPNMFGASSKPSLMGSRPDRAGPQLSAARSRPDGSDIRSSIGEGESSFRPSSQLGEGRNRPFAKFNTANRVSRPESKTKVTDPDEIGPPILETVSKPKVNFTGEIKTKTKKKDDGFFDDPMPDDKLKKQAKPDLMKSRPPGNRQVEESRAKDKDFFDDEADEVLVPVQEINAKPNLGKPRMGTSLNFQPAELREPVRPIEEKPSDPYEEFEVLSHEQGRL